MDTASCKRAFKCSFCGAEMVSSGNMRDHIRYHTGEKPFECETCGKTFATKNNLKGHMVVHSDLRPYVCEICGFAFKQKGLLKIHRTRHDPNLSRFTCHICGKKFFSSTEVKKHIPMHTGEKNYKCEICNKRFSQDSALARHRFIHGGDKPHQCEFCGMQFGRKEQFTRHLRKHNSKEDKEIVKLEKDIPEPIADVLVIEDESAIAADNLMDRETVYVQFEGNNYMYSMPLIEEDKGTSTLYQSMEIPVQQGEIIIELTDSDEHGKSIQYMKI